MAINQNLLDEINQALGNTVTPSLTTLNDACDLYEAYVFSLVLEAARDEGATISYYDRDGNSQTTFKFRTGPSAIYTPTASYSHAELRFGTKPVLELHVGVYMLGSAKVRHECDVSVIWKTEADRCRVGKHHPEYNKVELAAECKLYQASFLTIGLGRAFLGLTVDAKKLKACFVSNNKSSSISKLLKKHNKKSFMSVVPTNSAEVKVLTSYFREIFIAFQRDN